MNKLNRHDIGPWHAHAQKPHQGESPTAQRDFLEAIHVSLSQHDELVKRVKSLELALAAMQNREAIPEGMAPLIMLATEIGISTSKAEALAQNSGVMMLRQKAGVIVHEVKFREAALNVIREAKRKYGSKYWFHPLIGKFTMTRRPQA